MLSGCYSTTSSIFWEHQMRAWNHGSTSSFTTEGKIWGWGLRAAKAEDKLFLNWLDFTVSAEDKQSKLLRDNVRHIVRISASSKSCWLEIGSSTFGFESPIFSRPTGHLPPAFTISQSFPVSFSGSAECIWVPPLQLIWLPCFYMTCLGRSITLWFWYLSSSER